MILLEPAHTELLGDLDAASSADAMSARVPSTGQFDLSELQGSLDPSLQQLDAHALGLGANQALGKHMFVCCFELAGSLVHQHRTTD